MKTEAEKQRQRETVKRLNKQMVLQERKLFTQWQMNPCGLRFKDWKEIESVMASLTGK